MAPTSLSRVVPHSTPATADRRNAARTHRLSLASAGIAATLALALAPRAVAGDIDFSPSQLLPGDTALGLAVGHQEEGRIAAGGGGFLSVWSDCRASPDDSNAPGGSGYDIYGALLDADGNVTDSFMIDEGPGQQFTPGVAWNGTSWLVAWMEPTPSGSPTYERIRGVRVAPDGTVLDAEPFLIHQENWGCYCTFFGVKMAGGGPDGWVVLFRANAAGLRAVRVAGDGTVVNPNGLVVDNQIGGGFYDITFAQDEYMIVYGSGTNSRARRYSPTLQFLGQTSLPFAREVSTDGTNFLVAGQWDYSWPPEVEAILLDHDGAVLVPRFTVVQGTAQSGPSGEGTGFDGTNYWVTWGGNQAARIDATGLMLDPVGGFTLPLATQGVSWPVYDTAPGGGLQFVWNDGLGGAEYPRDAYTARVTPAAQVINQIPLSVNVPAQVEPDFARGPAGINMIAFRSRFSGSARILVQRLDDDGVALDPEPIEVASGPVQWLDTPSIDAPQVAWNGSVFMVVWSDTIDVMARRMNPDGSFVDATPLVIMPGRSSTVGALDGTFLVGGSLVVYSSGTLQPPGALRVARVDGVTGAVLDDPPIMVGGASDRHPHIVTLGDRWLVVWESVTYDPWSTSVFYATGSVFVDADGTVSDQLATDLSRRPNVAAAGDRALLVAVDAAVPGGTTNLDGRILMADGTFLGPRFVISTAPDEQLQPAATWTGTDFLAAWEDKRNSAIYFDERTDIYGARVTADGVVLDPGGLPFATDVMTESQPELVTIGGTTLMAVATLRSDLLGMASYRLGIQSTQSGLFCQTDLGFGGPGTATFSVCGDVLDSGGAATFALTGAPPSVPAFLVISAFNTPVPFKGGTLVPFPNFLYLTLTTDASGEIIFQLPGGGGPGTLYMQYVIKPDPSTWWFSNAVEVVIGP